MTPPRPSIRTTALAALTLVSIARAESVPTKERARVRQGPSATTELLGDVEPGTRVELLGENGGWRQVRTPDGHVGYIWGEHLALEPRAPAPGPRTLADEVHDLRDEVSALRQRPEPATAADLARVSQEIERIAAAEREIARRLDERILPTPADPPPESVATLAPALLAVGAVIGFVASRLLQGRHDRRQRSRLRL